MHPLVKMKTLMSTAFSQKITIHQKSVDDILEIYKGQYFSQLKDLQDHESLEAIFRKHNTLLPSSAAVENFEKYFLS